MGRTHFIGGSNPPLPPFLNKGDSMKILNNNVAVNNIRVMRPDAGDIILPDTGMTYGADAAISKRRYDCEIGTVVDIGNQVTDLEVGDVVFLAPLKGLAYKDIKVYDYTEIFGKVTK